MPEKKTIERARKAKRKHLAPSTQAGEFVREEIEHIREGKHGARSTEQAIAIGLSKARRAGVDLEPPAKGVTSRETRERAKRDLAKGRRKGVRKRTSAKRSRAMKRRLQREGTSAASKQALSRHARKVARRRTKAQRSASAMKGVHKRSHAERSASAKKAARTRARKRAARRH
jgi:hypothetical protein